MDLTPAEARAAVNAAIEEKFKKERKVAAKLVAISREDVKLTERAVKSINAGVDVGFEEDAVDHAETFINEMLKVLETFPSLAAGMDPLSSKHVNDIHDFWIHVEEKFKEHGRNWHGIEYKSKLRVFEATMDGVLKRNAKLAAFLDKKFDKVSRAETIKDKISRLEQAWISVDDCKQRIDPLQESVARTKDEIVSARSNVERLEDNELFGKKDELEAATSNARQRVQATLGKIEKSLRIFKNALDNNRITLTGITRYEVNSYLEDLISSIIKDGPAHPKLNIILDNVLACIQGEGQMKKDKLDKAVASIETMRDGKSLTAPLQAYINAIDMANEVSKKLEGEAIEAGIEAAGRLVRDLTSQQEQLDAAITREHRILSAARDAMATVQREIEEEMTALLGEPAHVLRP